MYAVGFVQRKIERVHIEQEAVWVSRYLGNANGDYSKLAEYMDSDPPPIGNSFFQDWRECQDGSVIAGKPVAAFKSSTFDGLQLTVYEDLSFEWVAPN